MVEYLFEFGRVEIETVFARFSCLKKFFDFDIGADHSRFRHRIGDIFFIHIDNVVKDFFVICLEYIIEEWQLILQTLEFLVKSIIAFERCLHRFDQFIDQFTCRSQIKQCSFELFFSESDSESLMDYPGLFSTTLLEFVEFIAFFHPLFFVFFKKFETVHDLFDTFIVFWVLGSICPFIGSFLFLVTIVGIFEAFKKLLDAAFPVEKRLSIVDDIVYEVGDGTDRIDDDIFPFFNLFAEMHLFLFGQKRNFPHFPKVHTHRTVTAAPLKQLFFFGKIKLLFEVVFSHFLSGSFSSFEFLLREKLGIFRGRNDPDRIFSGKLLYFFCL